jgi:HSP20 family protein
MSNAIVKNEPKTPAPVTPEPEAWLNPNVDICENKEGYTILAEMPGVNKSGLEVTVADNELVIIGRRAKAACQCEALHRETRPAHFRRAFELDPAINTDKISARMEQGVLTLLLPKAEKTKPRRISVGE